MRLEGKIALVTGGAKGIGRTFVQFLLQEGAIVFAVGRNQADLSDAMSQFEPTRRFSTFQVDVTQILEVERLRDALLTEAGRIDILVNNAGIAGPTTSLVDMDPSDWANVMESNLSSTFHTCKVFAPQMIRQRSGTIINMSSMIGKKPLLNRTAYGAAKMGVIGLTRSLALELGEYGITANAICPGYIKSSRIEKIIEQQASVRGISTSDVAKEFVDLAPLKRFVLPEDIAEMIVFLASPAGRNITGQDINVNAGMIMY